MKKGISIKQIKLFSDLSLALQSETTDGDFQLYHVSKKTGRANWHHPRCSQSIYSFQFFAPQLSENYYTINPIKGHHLRKSSNVAGYDALFADIDSIKLGHQDPTKTSREVLNEADKGNLMYPTAIVMTGHGLDLLYLFNREYLGSQKRWQDAENGLINSLLNSKVGNMVDTSVSDPARLLRMPETYNTKDYVKSGDKKDLIQTRILYFNSKHTHSFKSLAKHFEGVKRASGYSKNRKGGHRLTRKDRKKKVSTKSLSKKDVKTAYQKVMKHWGKPSASFFFGYFHRSFALKDGSFNVQKGILYDRCAALLKFRELRELEGRPTGYRNNVGLVICALILNYYAQFASKWSKSFKIVTKKQLANVFKAINKDSKKPMPEKETKRFVSRIMKSRFNASNSSKNHDLAKYSFKTSGITRQIGIEPNEQLYLPYLRSDKKVLKFIHRRQAKLSYQRKKEERKFIYRVYRRRDYMKTLLTDRKWYLWYKRMNYTYKQVAERAGITISKARRHIKEYAKAANCYKYVLVKAVRYEDENNNDEIKNAIDNTFADRFSKVLRRIRYLKHQSVWRLMSSIA